ncbi:cupin domain-containing protein [Haliangium sp.]|uniref:cupin domain-containing protein n=1 Tax=Haliangium sp. TaxID=2663208 RepID=UPI003D0CDF4F
MERYDVKDLVKLPGEGEQTATDMVIKARARDMGGDFSVMEGVIEPRNLLAPHYHKFEDQLVFVITGELVFEIGGVDGYRVAAPAGSYVQKPRGILHGFWNPTDTPSRYIELSGRAGFEGFVDSRKDGMLSTMHADRDWGVVFDLEATLRLLKDNELTGLAMSETPDLPKLPDLPAGLRTMFDKLGVAC